MTIPVSQFPFFRSIAPLRGMKTAQQFSGASRLRTTVGFTVLSIDFNNNRKPSEARFITSIDGGGGFGGRQPPDGCSMSAKRPTVALLVSRIVLLPLEYSFPGSSSVPIGHPGVEGTAHGPEGHWGEGAFNVLPQPGRSQCLRKVDHLTLAFFALRSVSGSVSGGVLSPDDLGILASKWRGVDLLFQRVFTMLFFGEALVVSSDVFLSTCLMSPLLAAMWAEICFVVLVVVGYFKLSDRARWTLRDLLVAGE